jgi:hypothetical protein
LNIEEYRGIHPAGWRQWLESFVLDRFLGLSVEIGNFRSNLELGRLLDDMGRFKLSNPINEHLLDSIFV